MCGDLQVAGQAGRADQVRLALQQLLRRGCGCAQRAWRRADEAADQALRWLARGLHSLGQRLLPHVSHRALSSDACAHIQCRLPGQQRALIVCDALIQELPFRRGQTVRDYCRLSVTHLLTVPGLGCRLRRGHTVRDYCRAP